MSGESAYRRGSVHRHRLPGSGGVTIHLCGPPGDIGRATRPTFGLAPGGVYRAVRVTPGAGALLPHRFTLTCSRRTVPSAVCFLWHCPSGRPDWPLAITLPCGAPTFLSQVAMRSAPPPSRGHPADSPLPFSHAQRRGRAASWPREAGRLQEAANGSRRRSAPEPTHASEPKHPSQAHPSQADPSQADPHRPTLTGREGDRSPRSSPAPELVPRTRSS